MWCMLERFSQLVEASETPASKSGAFTNLVAAAKQRACLRRNLHREEDDLCTEKAMRCVCLNQ